MRRRHAQTGARKLANVCLRYLGCVDDAAARALAVAHFDAADNMTDTFAALVGAEGRRRPPERDALFARFESEVARRAARARQVVRARGAGRSAPIRCARVQALLAHPRFNARNPNRVRSLVGAFALRNFARFHAADGARLRIRRGSGAGARRHQPAARRDRRRRVQPVEALSRSRGADCMQAALQRIAGAPGLSPDVTEVVTARWPTDR